MILVSVITGSTIGLERQWRKKIAGVRTMTLVSLGATIFVSLSTLVADDSSPTRIAAQVVSGIGFLAGGIILRDGFSITGLNTAATLWCTAAVGSMIGAGFILEGAIASLMIISVNSIIRFFSQKFDHFAQEYQQEEEDPLQSVFLVITGNSCSEAILRNEVIKQLDRYYLTFQHFSCHDLSQERVQLQIEIDPVVRVDAAIQEMVIHFSKRNDVSEVYQFIKEE